MKIRKSEKDGKLQCSSAHIKIFRQLLENEKLVFLAFIQEHVSTVILETQKKQQQKNKKTRKKRKSNNLLPNRKNIAQSREISWVFLFLVFVKM